MNRNNLVLIDKTTYSLANIKSESGYQESSGMSIHQKIYSTKTINSRLINKITRTFHSPITKTLNVTKILS